MRFVSGLLLLAGLSISLQAYAYLSSSTGHWLCQSYDAKGHLWYEKNTFRHRARKIARELCLKQSSMPATCTSLHQMECDHSAHESLIYWHCEAVDSADQRWVRVGIESKMQVLTEALIACQRYSEVAKSCQALPRRCLQVQ